MKSFLVLFVIVGIFLGGNALERVPFKDFFRHREPIRSHHNEPLPKSTVENTLTQYLDNFDNQNTARFEQRYFMNGEFFQPGGAIFLVLGGEWEISPWLLQDSLVTELAAENQAYMFYLEHRFYGKSVPTQNYTTANLRYLSVEQALADTAHFVKYIKSTYVTPGAESSHVIVIGQHYSGSLAVWFRQKYPHLTIGAWASSAPVLAKVDHKEYKELAGAVYRKFGGDSCYNRIENGFRQMEKMVADNQLDELSKLFALCTPLRTENDRRLFFSLIAEMFSYMTQIEDDEYLPIDGICDAISNDPTKTAAEAIGRFIVSIFVDECLPVNYAQYVEVASNANISAPGVMTGERQRLYQECSQLGWAHSSSSEFQPFGKGFPIDLTYSFCREVYGNGFTNDTMEEYIDRHNTVYGALNPDITYVLFTQGELDPWRTIGVQTDLNENSPAFVIKGASHANDMNKFSVQDSRELFEMKRKVLSLLHYWIAHADGNEVIPV